MTTDLTPLVHHLRRLASPPAPDSDVALLRRFARSRDDSAFAELTARHGPMVLRVCRRVLGDAHAAEDAFQATFLVLARRAGAVRRPEALAGWLYGVALRVARKARGAGFRRPPQAAANGDARPAPTPEPLTQLTARELLDGMDEEVQRLPEVYRLPVILCCLEGLTQEEAARRLGWTPGSVKGRLERGRARLHARLVRRGLTLAAALAAVEASRASAAALPALAGAGALAGSAAASQALALADKAAAGAASCPWKAAAPLILAVLLAGAGAGLLAARGTGGPPPRPQPAAPPASQARSGDAPQEVDRKDDKPKSDKDLIQGTWDVVSSAEGGLDVPAEFARNMQMVFTADAMIWRPKDSKDPKDTRRIRYTLDPTKDPKEIDTSHEIDPGKPIVQLGIYSLEGDTLRLCLAGAGQQRPTKLDGKAGILFLLKRAGAGKLRGQAVPLQGGVGGPVAFSPDGKLLAGGDGKTLCYWKAATGKLARTMNPPGGVSGLTYTRSRRFTIQGVIGPRFCPDTSWLAGVPAGPEPVVLRDAETGEVLRTLEGVEGAKGDGDVMLWDVSAGKVLRPLEGSAGAPTAYVFSPDSKLVAGVARDGKAQLWDVATGKVVRTLGGTQVHCVAFSPDGRKVAGDGRVWDVADGKELIAIPGHQFGMVEVAFSPDGKRLITAGTGPHKPGFLEPYPVEFEGQVKVWDAETGKELLAFSTNQTGNLDWACIAPDGAHVLTNGGWDKKTTVLWSLHGDD